MPHEHVVAGLATAIRAGALPADAVASDARVVAGTDDRPPCRALSAAAGGNVVSLTERRVAQLPADIRALPRSRDQLLRMRRTAEGTGS